MEFLFFDNVILNFLTSFLFIFTIFLYSNFLTVILEKNQWLYKNIYNHALVFFLNFAVISSVINYLILFDLISKLSLKILIFSFLIIYPIFFLKFKNILFSKKFFHSTYKVKNKDIYLFIFIFVLLIVSFFPISDADSLVTHLNLPLQIFLYGAYPENLDYVEFNSFAGSENLLILSLLLKSDNFGSILNSFSLIIISWMFIKDNRRLSIFFILSSPLIIFLVSTQKLQLFFALIYLLIYLTFKTNNFKSYFFLFIISFLLNFYASAKISYMLFAIPLFIYYLVKIKSFNVRILFTFFCGISFFAIFFPILLKKYLLFGDPFSPFFEYLKDNPDELTKRYALALRTSEGWLNSSELLKTFVRPFIPLKLSEISGSLGVGLLLIFLVPFLKKITSSIILAVIGVMLILSTGQAAPRYLLESYFLLSLNINYFKKNILNKFFLTAISFQFIVVFAFILVFMFASLKLLFPFTSKEKYFSEYAFSYTRAQITKKLNLDGNILDVEQTRRTLFYPNNFFSAGREIGFFTTKGEKHQFLKQYVKKNKIKFLIIKKMDYIPDCFNAKLLKKIKYKTQARRNFLVYKRDVITSNEVMLFEIKNNYCN